jgi:hypothetical protein
MGEKVGEHQLINCRGKYFPAAALKTARLSRREKIFKIWSEVDDEVDDEGDDELRRRRIV